MDRMEARDMARRHEKNAVRRSERPDRQEAALLTPSSGAGLSTDRLNEIIRLLAVCRRRSERHLVLLRQWHQLDLWTAAGLVDQTPAHAQEVLDSLAMRVADAMRVPACLGDLAGLNRKTKEQEEVT
jgi:hypothetical protein